MCSVKGRLGVHHYLAHTAVTNHTYYELHSLVPRPLVTVTKGLGTRLWQQESISDVRHVHSILNAVKRNISVCNNVLNIFPA